MLLLERQMLAAYGRLYHQEVGQLWPPDYRKRKAVQVLGGNLAATQVRYAEVRLREALPEVIQKLTEKQQPQVAALLLCEQPDLPTVVAELVRLERNVNHREEDPRLRVEDDDWKAKAIGFGQFRDALAGAALAQRRQKQPAPKPFGPPLELTPWPPRPLRAKKRRVSRYKYSGRAHLCYPQLSLGFPGGEAMIETL